MLIAAVRAAALVFVVQETESVVEAEPLEEETVSQEAVLVTIHAAAGLTVSWKSSLSCSGESLGGTRRDGDGGCHAGCARLNDGQSLAHYDNDAGTWIGGGIPRVAVANGPGTGSGGSCQNEPGHVTVG